MSDTPIKPLGERIPEHGIPDDDVALEVFLDWTAELGMTLYDAQEEAILELYGDSHVVLETPTGSGKSLVALALHFRELAQGRKSVYTAPIKALVSEKFFELCRAFGAENVGMLTGDAVVNRDAPIICCTAEVLARMSVRHGEDTPYVAVVMDEFHYYGDRDRGMAWQLPLITMPHAQFLLMSATLGDTRAIIEDIEERSGRPVARVHTPTRPVPLTYEYSTTPLHEIIPKLVTNNKAPLYVVHFTQRAAAETAGSLMSTDVCSKEEKGALKKALKGFRFDSPFGPTLSRFLRHGVAVHHAGLLPRYRLLVEKLAQQGLLKIICGTDTLGVGINVPIRAVLFTQLCKFDGESVDILRVRDFHQIAGRAGRKGFDDEGLVVAQAPAWVIENLMLAAAVSSGRKKSKKVRKSKAPTKGYRHWTEATFQRLVTSPPEALIPSFKVDHGLLLTLLQKADAIGGDGLAELHGLIDQSHAPQDERAALHQRADELLEELVAGGVIEDFIGEHMVADELQRDFSMNQSLSLFLLHAISKLDREDPDYALHLLTLVEAILENPRVVLYAQISEEKGRIINELKLAGIPYEERMEAIEDVSWPKPHAEWIYSTFNTYREKHPWVDAENIRPKSIARDIMERFSSFSDYTKDLRLERAEGVLLRYISQVYKALQQSVPTEALTADVVEVQAFFRAMLARVDSSLVTEWERMAAGDDAPVDEAPRPVDISLDRRAFEARVRAELHALLRALSRQDYEDAAACLRQRDPPHDARPLWEARDLKRALAPFLEEYERVRFDAQARLAHHVQITPIGHHRWTVRQVLVDMEEHNEWSLDGEVDLTDDVNPEGPLVELVAVGV